MTPDINIFMAKMVTVVVIVVAILIFLMAIPTIVMLWKEAGLI